MLRSDYKTHYKMYKAKKNVVYATMFTFAMLGSLGLAQTAKADTTENASSQPTVQTTVNSAAQATNQTVANSAVNSTVPASQVSAAPSSVTPAAPVNQPSQAASTVAPATAVNTFKVAQNSMPLANLMQSFIQTNQTNQAQNVSATLKLQSQPTANNMTTADISLSFDLTADQLHGTQPIQIGTFGTDSSNNGYKLAMQVAGAAGNPIKRNGITYGDLEITTASNGMYDSNTFGAVAEFYPATNLNNVIGTQHFSVSLPNELNINYQTSPAAFDSNGNLNTNLIFTDAAGHQTTFDHISLHVPDATATLGKITDPHNLNTLFAMRFNSGLVRADQNNWLTFNNINEFNQFIDSGNNVDTLKLRPTIQDAMRIAPDPNQTLGLTSNDGTSIIRAYVVNDDGTLSAESFELPYVMWKAIRLQDAGDNQSLNDLKNKNFNGILFSRQNNGSYIIYTNVNSEDLINNIDYDQLRNYLKIKSFQINFHEKDPEKAIDNTINAIKHGLLVYDNGVCLYPTDPTLPAHLNMERLDLNTGQPNGETTNTVTVPISSMASGQSAVKLHVINAQNGADLVPLDLLQCKAKG